MLSCTPEQLSYIHQNHEKPNTVVKKGVREFDCGTRVRFLRKAVPRHGGGGVPPSKDTQMGKNQNAVVVAQMVPRKKCSICNAEVMAGGPRTPTGNDGNRAPCCLHKGFARAVRRYVRVVTANASVIEGHLLAVWVFKMLVAGAVQREAIAKDWTWRAPKGASAPRGTFTARFPGTAWILKWPLPRAPWWSAGLLGRDMWPNLSPHMSRRVRCSPPTHTHADGGGSQNTILHIPCCWWEKRPLA